MGMAIERYTVATWLALCTVVIAWVAGALERSSDVAATGKSGGASGQATRKLPSRSFGDRATANDLGGFEMRSISCSTRVSCRVSFQFSITSWSEFAGRGM